jgi:hypothetical protein
LNQAIRKLRNMERSKRNGKRYDDKEISTMPNFKKEMDHLVYKDEKEVFLKRFYENQGSWHPTLDIAADDDLPEPLESASDSSSESLVVDDA